MKMELTLQTDYYKITIALAGIVQAAYLIKELAYTGKIDDKAFETCIYSLFQTEPEDITAVYGEMSHLKIGFENLIELLNGITKQNKILIRYVMAMLRAVHKIQRSSRILNTLTQRITQAKKQVSYFSVTHPLVIANLADIYLESVSTFHFRIMILGNVRVLNTNIMMEKIRALLLAGIRSGILWKQVRGSRLQLFFRRSHIKNMAQNMLHQLNRTR